MSKINIIRIALFHLSALLVFYVGVSSAAIAVFLVSFILRTFGIAAGYHRYFSHRSFQTSRVFQFILGFLGASSGQKGPLSWVTSHRIHHQMSDKPGDPHSPRRGFFYGYIGWLLPVGALPTDLKLTADFAQFPEILWLNKHYNVATLAVIVLCGALGFYLGQLHPELNTGALQLIVWGFILSGLVSLHGTMLVNTVCHLSPKLHASTNDYSRNVAWLFPLTLGENWHHNHHQFPKSANCGLEKWQPDLIYVGICLIGKLGLVWNIKNQNVSPISSKRKLAQQ